MIAMNFLYAKIVGRRVRLNPLAVTVSLMFWGSIWGGIGLILAVPVMAAVKAICDNVESLEPYGRLRRLGGRLGQVGFDRWRTLRYRQRRLVLQGLGTDVR